MDKQHRTPVIGDVFDELVVTEVLSSGKGITIRLQCSCGREVGPLRTVELYRKRRTDKPRTCRNCAARWNAVKNPESDIAKTLVWSRYRNQAKNRGLEWSLTRDEMVRLCSSPCVYCGEPWSSVATPQQSWKREWRYNGIDRIDSSHGYVLGNVQPCCKWCNRAKSDREESDFLDWAKKVTAYAKK